MCGPGQYRNLVEQSFMQPTATLTTAMMYKIDVESFMSRKFDLYRQRVLLAFEIVVYLAARAKSRIYGYKCMYLPFSLGPWEGCEVL